MVKKTAIALGLLTTGGVTGLAVGFVAGCAFVVVVLDDVEKKLKEGRDT